MTVMKGARIILQRISSANPQGNRLDKRSSQHSQLPGQVLREFLWLSYQKKSIWVDAGPGTWDPQLQVGLGRKQGFSCAVEQKRSNEVCNLCKEGELDRALDVFFYIDQQGYVPSIPTFTSLLKACAKRKALAQARRLCTYMSRHGLETTRFLGEYIVNTLVKCDGLQDAVQVFHNLKHRTVFSWTAIISGYAMSGQSQEALKMYDWMQNEGVQPNTYTLVSLLKACGSIPDLEEGRRIHAVALEHDCEKDVFVGTCLVDMYGKCGSPLDSQIVFNGMSERSVISWNAILSAYVQNGQIDQVFQLYKEMREDGIDPNERTFISMLQACGALAEKEHDVIVDQQLTKLNSLSLGKAIHATTWIEGYTSDIFIGSTLVSMYSKCGSIVDAQQVFDGLSHRNVVAWTAMLAAFAQQGQAEEALQLYEQMLDEGVSPNFWTFATALQACGTLAEKEQNVLVGGEFVKLRHLEKGKAIHAMAWKKNFDSDLFVTSTLISMYGKCGSISHAQYLFDELSEQNVVSWNALLATFVQQSQAEKVLQFYKQMQEDCVSPDDLTFVCLLQACGMLAQNEEDGFVDGLSSKLECLDKGKTIHASAWSKGYKSNVLIGNTLISMYGKSGSMTDAQNVFAGLTQRNVVTWTAMLAAYAQWGQFEKVLETFNVMKEEGVSPDEITLVCVLHTCSSTGGLDVCKQIHYNLVGSGHELSPLLASTLIDSFGRCASMGDAETVFDSLLQPDVASWTALVAGHARQGNCAASLQRFEAMQMAGIKPNGITFLSVLAACSHAGLVDKGVQYFESMSREHGITPRIEHYVSVVDLLGRAGCFTRMEDLLSTMPIQPNLAIWLCLLGACRKHGKVVLGKHAFDCAVDLQPKHAAAYVLMSNIYTDAGLQDCARKMHALRRKEGAWKKPGQSWIDHKQKVHIFVVGDQDCRKEEDLYNMLWKISLDLDEGIVGQQSPKSWF